MRAIRDCVLDTSPIITIEQTDLNSAQLFTIHRHGLQHHIFHSEAAIIVLGPRLQELGIEYILFIHSTIQLLVTLRRNAVIAFKAGFSSSRASMNGSNLKMLIRTNFKDSGVDLLPLRRNIACFHYSVIRKKSDLVTHTT